MMNVRTIVYASIIVLLTVVMGTIIYSRAIQVVPAPPYGPAAATHQGDDKADVTPSPSLTPIPTPKPTSTPVPTPSIPDIDINDWQYRLVNRDNPLEEGFEPDITYINSEQGFDSRALEALQVFIKAAEDAGMSAFLSSSYRSHSVQQYLFDNMVAQKQAGGLDYDAAVDAARKIVAYPGTSEHELGLAADITDRYYAVKTEALADTELLKWMLEHCAEHGFILRYPKSKQDITNVIYEPWHFRYVGVEAATYIMENDLCLEEFHELYK